MIFYALVCGVLGAVAPRFQTAKSRIAFGAGVGIVAAVVLPLMRGVIG